MTREPRKARLKSLQACHLCDPPLSDEVNAAMTCMNQTRAAVAWDTAMQLHNLNPFPSSPTRVHLAAALIQNDGRITHRFVTTS